VLLGDHGLDRAGRRLAGREAVVALERAPAEVRAAALALAHEVDLLDSFWPTSPIVRSPVERSNENRHGLRSP
jgi:hypothetical protein